MYEDVATLAPNPPKVPDAMVIASVPDVFGTLNVKVTVITSPTVKPVKVIE
jgi:hypothetical protein